MRALYWPTCLQDKLTSFTILFLPELTTLCLVSTNNRKQRERKCLSVNSSMCADGLCTVVLTVGVITHQSIWLYQNNSDAERLCYDGALCPFSPEDFQGLFKIPQIPAMLIFEPFSFPINLPLAESSFILPAWLRWVKVVTGGEARGEKGRERVISKVGESLWVTCTV